MNKVEKVSVRMVNGDWSEMEVCGQAPPHNGQRAIVLTNGEGCFGARLTPNGWVMIDEPMRLYPIR
jgi:hypothetical protein